MELPQDIKNINKMLDKVHGRAFNNRPWYRVVWTSDQTEKRMGVFRDYHGSIFIREHRGVREVPKYNDPGHRDRWVLEKLIFIENPELLQLSNEGSYEPIWIFRGPGGSYIKPVWKSVEFLIGMLNTPKEHQTQAMLDAAEESTLEAETASIKDMLDDVTDTQIALRQGEGIVVPHNYIGRK